MVRRALRGAKESAGSSNGESGSRPHASEDLQASQIDAWIDRTTFTTPPGGEIVVESDETFNQQGFPITEGLTDTEAAQLVHDVWHSAKEMTPADWEEEMEYFERLEAAATLGRAAIRRLIETGEVPKASD